MYFNNIFSSTHILTTLNVIRTILPNGSLVATTTMETHLRQRKSEHEQVRYRERILDLKSETSFLFFFFGSGINIFGQNPICILV